MTEAPVGDIRVRDLRLDDLDSVTRIDALQVGEREPTYWRSVLERFLDDRRRPGVGLAAERRDGVVGYLLGEVRAFELGSEPCGWIFGIGADPTHGRRQICSMLLAEGCRRFRASETTCVRAMVRRNDVASLSLFRASGFVHGSFVQLELDLEATP